MSLPSVSIAFATLPSLALSLEIIQYVEKAFDDVASSLGNAANIFQNGLDSAIGGVSSALGDIPGLGDRATIPIITINTSFVSNVSPPDSWSGPLNELNMKLPTVDDLRTALANLIDTPFNTLRGQITNAFSAVASTFNAAQLPLSAVHIAETSALILLGLVIAVAIGNALVEWYRFRQVQTTIRP